MATTGAAPYALSGAPVDFSTALSSYRALSLPSLQSHLAQLVSPLTAIQTASLTSRKKLADQTRNFKKLSDEHKVEEFKPLLKAYQLEIDELTKRAREAEGGLRKAQERLADVVDPVVILESVIDQVAGLADLDALKEQNTKLQTELASLRQSAESAAQLETDRNQLSERLASLEASFEKRLAEARSEAEAEVTARLDERLSNAQAREAELSRSLSLAQEQVKQLRASHENTTERLLSSAADPSQSHATGGGDYEMLAADLQRSNERVAAVERRNEQLREEVERVKSGRSEAAHIVRLEEKLREAEEDKARAQSLLQSHEEKRERGTVELQKRMEHVEAALKERDADIAQLRAKLEEQSDYTELKRELEIIRVVEFSGGLDDDDDDEGDDAGNVGETKGAKPLEALLLGKNKRLQDELTTLRVAHNDLSQASTQTTEELSALKAEVSKMRALNEKLENDLLEVGVGAAQPKKRAERPATKGMSAEEALEEMGRIEKEEGAVVADTGVDADVGSSEPANKAAQAATETTTVTQNGAAATKPGGKAATSVAGASSGGDNTNGVLPIIVSQRDRFRSRNAELEEELRKQFELITSLRNEVKSLQSDNLALYEKVRYLQSYNPSAAGTSGTALAAAARQDPSQFDAYPYPPAAQQQHTKVPMNLASKSAGGEERWRSRYEESMNPFEQFRGREQSRAFSSLNPLERLLHMLTRVILADRRMRIAFMVYAVGMHLFIFAILVDYTFASSFSPAAGAPAQAAGLDLAAGCAADASGGACAAPH